LPGCWLGSLNFVVVVLGLHLHTKVSRQKTWPRELHTLQFWITLQKVTRRPRRRQRQRWCRCKSFSAGRCSSCSPDGSSVRDVGLGPRRPGLTAQGARGAVAARGRDANKTHGAAPIIGVATASAIRQRPGCDGRRGGRGGTASCTAVHRHVCTAHCTPPGGAGRRQHRDAWLTRGAGCITSCVWHQVTRINELAQAFPQVPRSAIEADVRRTGSLEATVENLLSGRLQVRRLARHLAHA